MITIANHRIKQNKYNLLCFNLYVTNDELGLVRRMYALCADDNKRVFKLQPYTPGEEEPALNISNTIHSLVLRFIIQIQFNILFCI